jgi:integrase
MPEAGNSVAAWLLRGRPGDADSPCVFVRLVPPHVGLMSTTACEAALRHALGDAYGDCEGFHELRRTYATEILRGGSGVRTVTEALGHRSEASARPYLSLDEERMRLCAMPLGEAARYPRRGGASDGKS